MTDTLSRALQAEVDAFLAGYTTEVQAIALRLRALVFEVAPGAIEQIDIPGKMLAYGFARTYKDMICVIMPLKAGVNFGMPRGAELDDPDGLLEGTGKRARHAKISAIEQVEEPAIRALLQASIDQLK
jgi:hypothetical protein